MQKLKNILMSAVLVFASVAGVVAMPVGLVSATGEEKQPTATGGMCPDGKTQYTHSIAECGISNVGGNTTQGKDDLMTRVKSIINVVLGIVGVVAVVVIIVAGVYFILSQGDAAKIARARNTILYGVVGLLVALLAFAIVNFVFSSVF